jgi:molybdate transport system regulatory protein
VGPGKIDLLRQVAETRSISAAARAMGMTYKRAWLLIDSLNQGFGEPVVEASAGGKGGGGAHLTPLGEALVLRATLHSKRTGGRLHAGTERSAGLVAAYGLAM